MTTPPARAAVTVRPAVVADDAALLHIDRLTQTPLATPGQYRADKEAFFAPEAVLSDHLVAEVGGVVVGYVAVEHPTPLTSNRHVMQISGLAVDPKWQGNGVGRALMDAMLEQLRARDVGKATLRVLGWNRSAIALYRSCGFQPEGVLRAEFYLEGQYVDDVLMARQLVPLPVATQAVSEPSS